MALNYSKMKSERLSIDEKKACALVLSYYTGYKDNSDRSSRNTNVLIRGLNSFAVTNKWSDGEKYYPVIYYLTKALSILPFYWGYTIRCVHLTKEQAFSYKPGIVVKHGFNGVHLKLVLNLLNIFQKEILGFIFIHLILEKFHNFLFILMKKKLFIHLFLIF